MLEIITNNQPRNLVCGHELTDDEKAQFSYLDDIDSHNFVKFKCRVLDPDEFMVTSPEGEFSEWSGVHNETFYSGILIKYTEDREQVIMGSYYC